MSTSARVLDSIKSLDAAIAEAESQIPKDRRNRPPAWWTNVRDAANAVAGDALDAIGCSESDLATWRDGE